MYSFNDVVPHNDLRCKDCVAPERHPGCHAECKWYIEWKKEHDKKSEDFKKEQWLKGLGLNPKKTR